MAPLIERRSTTTRTTRTEGTSELKSNLSTVQEELARVRDSARQEAESLDKIRSLLDADALNGLIRTIEELETRLETLQTEAEGGGAAGPLRAELEQEQERLRKLWDAYKTQEDELNRVRRDYPLMEEKLFERERTIEALRRDLARLEPLAKQKKDMDDAITQGRALRTQVDQLNNELRRAKERNDVLLSEAARLREDAASKGRVTELESALEEERERLAKLYKVYEDQEAEKKALDGSIAAWEAWFEKYGTLMDRMCGAAGEAPSRQK